jgi:hypothetical protein
MDTAKQIAEYLEERLCDTAVIFTNPDYASAFIGISNDDRAVYDYSLMIDWLCREWCMTTDEAVEYLDDALSYHPLHGPIVVFPSMV